MIEIVDNDSHFIVSWENKENIIVEDYRDAAKLVNLHPNGKVFYSTSGIIFEVKIHIGLKIN